MDKHQEEYRNDGLVIIHPITELSNQGALPET
jgi:hypothetical protein